MTTQGTLRWHLILGWAGTLLSAGVSRSAAKTKLALDQGGYDWAALAYAVGFGGSMIWFGSSAGVAVSNLFPEAKSVVAWVREGWHVAVGYAVGFIALQAFMGWRPS